MELYLFFTIVSFVKSLPLDNPALLDMLKVVIGSTAWISSMVAYVYWREQKLKTSTANK